MIWKQLRASGASPAAPTTSEGQNEDTTDDDTDSECEGQPAETEKKKRPKRQRSVGELAAEIEDLQSELALAQREAEVATNRVEETERNLRAEKIKQVKYAVVYTWVMCTCMVLKRMHFTVSLNFFFFCQYIFYKDGQIANRS